MKMEENITWGGILFVVSNVVVHHDDDPFVGNSILPQYLVSVADIRLVAVVEVAVGSRDQHGPMFRFAIDVR